MILPDVNVLIYAFYEPAPEHAACAAWLNGVRAAGGDILLPATVLTGFLRIVTNSKIIARPPTTTHALSFVAALRSARGAREVTDEQSV